MFEVSHMKCSVNISCWFLGTRDFSVLALLTFTLQKWNGSNSVKLLNLSLVSLKTSHFLKAVSSSVPARRAPEDSSSLFHMQTWTWSPWAVMFSIWTHEHIDIVLLTNQTLHRPHSVTFTHSVFCLSHVNHTHCPRSCQGEFQRSVSCLWTLGHADWSSWGSNLCSSG